MAGERRILVALCLLALAVRIAYVLATRHLALAGDELEYDLEGRLLAAGHPFWTRAPYGILHASAWKAPGYPAWVGGWYALLGPHPLAVRLIQTLSGPVEVTLTWTLARRLIGPRTALAAAGVLAVYPFAFQYQGLLYSESLAVSLGLALLVWALTGAPTLRRAAGAGLLLGLNLLVRPSAVMLLAGLLTWWWLTAGVRRAVALTVVTVAVAVAVVAPWTVRNAVVEHGFIPVSIQDAAGYGTFNAQSASDPVYPYAWRPDPLPDRDLFDPRHPRSDVALRAALSSRTRSYVVHHPGSLAAAFFWNGLSRLWDVRRPARALNEVAFEGRSRRLTQVGLAMYWAALALALVGLGRLWRRRRAFVVTALALALAASVVFTSDAGTRYRAPLEPLIVILACAALLGPEPVARARTSMRSRRSGAHSREASPAAPAAATSERPSAGE